VLHDISVKIPPKRVQHTMINGDDQYRDYGEVIHRH